MIDPKGGKSTRSHVMPMSIQHSPRTFGGTLGATRTFERDKPEEPERNEEEEKEDGNEW
jgi:hypothetical protein